MGYKQEKVKERMDKWIQEAEEEADYHRKVYQLTHTDINSPEEKERIRKIKEERTKRNIYIPRDDCWCKRCLKLRRGSDEDQDQDIMMEFEEYKPEEEERFIKLKKNRSLLPVNSLARWEDPNLNGYSNSRFHPSMFLY